MKGNKTLHIIAFILLAIAGVQWGLIGIGAFTGLNLDLIYMVLGSWPMLISLLYVLVGLSAVYELATHKYNCRMCNSGGMM